MSNKGSIVIRHIHSTEGINNMVQSHHYQTVGSAVGIFDRLSAGEEPHFERFRNVNKEETLIYLKWQGPQK